jgi:hypothetical protein
MTGTPSRTARAVPRGTVWRKLEAKSRPEEHEVHEGERAVGEGAVPPEAQSHPEPPRVDATGRWDESRVSYPPRSAWSPEGAREAGRPTMGRQKSAEAKVVASQRGERAEHEVKNRNRTFDA